MNYVFFIIFFVVYCCGAACDAEIIFIPCVFPQFFENPKHKDKAQLSGDYAGTKMKVATVCQQELSKLGSAEPKTQKS